MESIWHRAPFLRLVIALILGAASGFYLPLDSVLFYLVVAVSLILLTILLVFAIKWKYHRYELVFGVLLISCFFFVGIALSLGQEIRNSKRLILPGKAESSVAELAEYPQKKEKSVRLVLKLNSQKNINAFKIAS